MPHAVTREWTVDETRKMFDEIRRYFDEIKVKLLDNFSCVFGSYGKSW